MKNLSQYVPRDQSIYLTLSLSFLLALHAGTTFAFSAFAKEIALFVNVQQQHVAIIGSIADIGFFLSIVPGVAFYFIGMIPTLAGSMILILSWFLLYLSPNFYFVSFCFFVIGLGSAGLLMIAVTINSGNFGVKSR